MKGISKNAQKIDGQPMFKMLEEIKKLEKKGKNIIHFEIGDPDFKTPMNIIRASYRAMINGYTHYASSYGLEEFRKEICKTTKSSTEDINNHVPKSKPPAVLLGSREYRKIVPGPRKKVGHATWHDKKRFPERNSAAKWLIFRF